MSDNFTLINILPTWIMEMDFPDPETFIPYFDQFNYRDLNSHMSAETDILDREPFTRIRDLIIPNLNEIVKGCGYEGENIGVRITQSWCVKTTGGQDAPTHIHPNSQFSGVCYFNDSSQALVLCREDMWYDSRMPLRVFDCFDHNLFFHQTHNQFRYEPRAGKIIIFPSVMKHYVEMAPPEVTETRYSLAFNTFLTGKIMSDSTLASIVL